MNLETLGKRLAIEEGDRLVAYLDTRNILTVGRGHNCVSKPVIGIANPGDRITPEQDDALFADDVQDACAELDSYIKWWRNLDSDRQNVMLDLVFNLGIGTLCTFHNTLSYVKNGQWDLAADGMAQSLWAQQVGARAVWLENAMRKGQYT